MTTLSFISAESAASFMAAPQDVSIVSDVYEQFGSYKINVVFDGLTTVDELEDKIFPEGMVIKGFDDDGNQIQ